MARPRAFDMDTVLKAALHTFWRCGYEATSMAELMTAMNLQKGSIYKAFGDKRSLFIKALVYYMEQAYIGFSTRLRQAESPLAGIRAWFCDAINQSEDGVCRGCFAVNSLVELGPHDPEVAEIVAEHQNKMDQLVTEVIGRGQVLGEVRRDIPAENLAKMIMQLTTGVMAKLKGKQTREEALQVIDTTFKLMT